MTLTQKKAKLGQLSHDFKTLNADMERDEKLRTSENAEKLDRMFEDGKALKAEIEREEFMAGVDAHVNQPGERQTTDTPAAAAGDGAKAQPWNGHGSPGGMLVKSQAFEQLRQQGTQQARVGVGFLPIGAAKTVVSLLYSGTPANLIRADRLNEIVDIARQRPPSIIDLVNRSETQLAAVEFARLTARQNLAAIVAENASKPQGDLTFDLVTVAVKVIAEWVKASKQILDDAPRLRNIIDNELTYQVQDTLEATVVADILATSGIQTRAHQDTGTPARGAKADDTIADTLRRAITDIRLAFYEPDGIALAPADSESMELDKAADGHYTMIYDPVAQRVWRKPVVESTQLTQGTAIVAAFRLGYTIWDRMDAQTMVGYVNDDFTKNLVTILAELRAAYGATRPLAIEKVTALA